MSSLTVLERLVLEAIATREDGMADWLARARVIERRNTGHGFYADFDLGAAPAQRLPSRMNGPFAEMLDMGPGMTMGFQLWCENGSPSTLEGYQNCDDNGETVDLTILDLGALRAVRLFWL